jgi:hypothetical protein
MRWIVCSLVLASGLLLAGASHNPRPCPIPALEMLPPNPPPDVPSPAERAAAKAHWHSNRVARAEERAAYLELVTELAGKQGADAKDLDREDTETVSRRAKILRKAAKDSGNGKGK